MRRANFASFHLLIAALAFVCFCQPEVTAQPSVVASPSSGGLGTVVTLSVTPQTPGFGLRANTTARWVGVYDPPIGSNTAQFTADYAGVNIVIVDSWTARVLIGGGTISNAPNVEAVWGGGSLVGAFTLTTPPVCLGDATFDNSVNFADITSVNTNWGANYGPGNTGPGDANRDGSVNFADITSVLENWGAACASTVVQGSSTIGLDTNAEDWYRVHYPSGYGGLSSPQLGRLLTTLPLLRLLLLPSGANPTLSQIQAAVGAHLVAAVSVASNSQSLVAAPSTISVDIVSVTTAGAEVARLGPVILTRVVPDPSPNLLMYSSGVTVPIVLVDTPLNPATYPGFRFLLSPLSGVVRVAPRSN